MFGSFYRPITYSEVFNQFKEHAVKYVIVGGFAKYLYSFTNTYNDIDILYEISEQNIEKIIDIITSITNEDKSKYSTLYSKDKFRVNLSLNEQSSFDFINELRGYDYYKCLQNAQIKQTFGVDSHVCSPKDLEILKQLRDEDANLTDSAS